MSFCKTDNLPKGLTTTTETYLKNGIVSQDGKEAMFKFPVRHNTPPQSLHYLQLKYQACENAEVFSVFICLGTPDY